MSKTKLFPVLIVVFIVLGLGISYFLSYWQHPERAIRDRISNPTEKVVSIELSSIPKDGGSIKFVIRNNTNKPIYYFPETCASELVSLEKKSNSNFEFVRRRVYVCMLVSEPIELLPGQKIDSQISQEDVKKFIEKGSIYHLAFEYSEEKVDRWGLGKKEKVYSSEFSL